MQNLGAQCHICGVPALLWAEPMRRWVECTFNITKRCIYRMSQKRLRLFKFKLAREFKQLIVVLCNSLLLLNDEYVKTYSFTHGRWRKASNPMKLNPLKLNTITCLNQRANLNLKGSLLGGTSCRSLYEKLLIICQPEKSSLNHRNELVSTCQ